MVHIYVSTFRHERIRKDLEERLLAADERATNARSQSESLTQQLSLAQWVHLSFVCFFNFDGYNNSRHVIVIPFLFSSQQQQIKCCKP